MALAERGLKPLVVDLDLSGRLSSSEKNAGGVRAIWWQPVNIRLCRESIRYYESIAGEIGFRQHGYLWLYGEATWPQALDHLPLQRELGHPIETLTAAEVNRRVPEIDRLDGIAGATFSPRDGLVNSNLLKEHYRTRSRALGAEYLDRTFVIAIDSGPDAVRLQCWPADDAIPDEALVRLLTEDGPGEAEAGHLFELRAGAIAITGGAWSGNALRLAGLENLSEPIRRQICLVDSRTVDLSRYGMIVDTTGLCFHSEGNHILAGYSPADEPSGYHFNYDGERFFMDEIWPRLYARISGCERLRHVTGWAGLYEVSPDRSAILGAAAPRIFEAARRDAILWRGAGAGGADRARPLRSLRRCRARSPPLCRAPAGLGRVAYLKFSQPGAMNGSVLLF